MARPTGYTPDPSGAVNVVFDDGTSLLMDPRQKRVAEALAGLPDLRTARGTPEDIAKSLAVNTDPGPVGPGGYIPPPRSAFAITPTPVASDVSVIPGVDVRSQPSVAANIAPMGKIETGLPKEMSALVSQGAHFNYNMMADLEGERRAMNQQNPGLGSGPTIDPSSRIMLNGAPGGQAPGAIGPNDFRIIPGTPGRFVKGGRTPQSWQTTREEGLPISDEMKAQIAQNEEDLRQAGQLSQQAAQERSDIESRFAADESWQRRLANEAQKRVDASRALQEEDAVRRYDAAKVVDPERLWHNASAGEKFGAQLGIAAGAFLQGAGMTANNPVLDQVNRMIERDTNAQVQNLQNADADIKRMYAQWDREDQRKLAGEAARYDAAKLQVEDWMSGVKSAEAKARGLELAAKLGQEAVNRKLELARIEGGKTVSVQHDVQTPDRVVGGSAARVDASGAIRKYFENGGSAEELQKAVQAGTTAGLSKDAAAAAFLQGQSASSGTGGGTAPLSEKDQAAAVSYSKALAESKAPDFNAAAAQLREMASGSSPDDRVPGFSMGANIAKAVMPAGTHEWVTSDRGYANQQRMSWIQTLLGQVISGASVSPSQEAAIIKVTSGRGSAKDFETAAATLEQTAKTRAEAAASGYKPSVVSAVHARQSALQPKVAFDSAARQEKAK